MRRFKFPKLSHPWAKSAAGFTLVELIVVIAILGVLAGVGTVGYSGYVKSANKKADMVLVGNIIRAIETGTNSTMFVPPDSMSVSATTFPIGAIVLSPTPVEEGGGVKVLTTTGSKVDITATEGECHFSPLTVTYLEYKTPSKAVCADCGKSAEYIPAIAHTVEINYCTTHSSATYAPLNSAKDYYEPNTTYKKSSRVGCWHHSLSPKKEIAKNTNFTDNFAQLYQAGPSGNCTLVENAGLNINTDPNLRIKINDTNNALYQAIDAAFGTNDLVLTYNNWGNVDDKSEAHNYSTMYTEASVMMEDIIALSAELGKMCTTTVKVLGVPVNVGESALDFNILGGAYGTGGNYTSEDGTDIVTSISQAFMTEFGDSVNGRNKWMGVWNTAATYTWTGYDYGLGAYGREYYSAMRKLYNNGFASYLSANGVESKYADVVRNFDREISADNPLMQSFINTIGASVNVPKRLPATVNGTTFDDTSSGLKERFIAAAGDGEGAEEEALAAFDRCEKLFDLYKDSDAYSANGNAVYNTFITVGENAGEATDPDNAYGGNFFEYVDSYLKEMEALYANAHGMASDGIVIMVTMENDVVTCDVSPASANPRKD